MNIYECQRKAQNEGFDSMEFMAKFPAGLFKCQWLDAYLGLVQVDADGIRDGFIMVKQISEMFPDLHCIPLSSE